MRKQPHYRGNCWRKAPGIINWWMNWSAAWRYCAAEATLQRFLQYALDSILRSRGIRHLVFTGIATTSASNRRYAMAFFWSISAWSGRRNTPGGAGICTESRVVQIETFFGWVSDVETFCDALSPRPLLVSLKEFNDAKIRNYSLGSSAPLAPFVPGTLADGVVMSPVRWLLINIITCCLPMTQGANPPRSGNHPQGDRDGGWPMADVTFNSIFITDWKNYAALTKSTPSFFRVTNRRDSAFRRTGKT